MTNKKIFFVFLLPVLVSFILHFHVLPLDVIGYHAWRQSQTQTVIYHFTFTDHSIFHPQRFDLSTGTSSLLYEFPLFQWLIAQVNLAFGYSVLNSRLFTFVVFVFLLFGFYKLTRHFVSDKMALMMNVLICFSPILYYYCINPMPDLFALCLGIWALHFFFSFIRSRSILYFVCFVFFLTLAALVKLPFILFAAVYPVYFFRTLKTKAYSKLIFQSLLFLVFLIPVFLWYQKAIPTWKNNEVASGIFFNNKTWLQLADYFQFHLLSSVPELITNYASCVFLVVGMYWFVKRYKQLIQSQTYFVFLFLILVIYFFYELNMIEKVHDYYLMPFVPLIFMVVAYGLKHFYEKQQFRFIYFILCIVPITAWLRIDGRWNQENPGFNSDYLYEQSVLQKVIPAESLCIIDSDDSKFISLYYLKRYGFCLYENELDAERLSGLYQKGARYLVTENLKINTSEYPQFNFEEIFSKNLRLFKIEKP